MKTNLCGLFLEMREEEGSLSGSVWLSGNVGGQVAARDVDGRKERPPKRDILSCDMWSVH